MQIDIISRFIGFFHRVFALLIDSFNISVIRKVLDFKKTLTQTS